MCSFFVYSNLMNEIDMLNKCFVTLFNCNLFLGEDKRR